jgi:hypothetical protein
MRVRECSSRVIAAIGKGQTYSLRFSSSAIVGVDLEGGAEVAILGVVLGESLMLVLQKVQCSIGILDEGSVYLLSGKLQGS